MGTGYRGQKSRPPLKSGDEYDAFTRWRRFFRWKPGRIREIKRRYGKRARREGRKDTLERDWE